MASVAPIRRMASALGSSVAASLLDLTTLLLLVRLAKLEVGIAAAVGCLVGGAVNFWISRRWVFRGRGGRAAHHQLALYGLLVVLGGALIAGTLTQLAYVSWRFPLTSARLLAGALVFCLWSYPISNRVVFRRPALVKEPS